MFSIQAETQSIEFILDAGSTVTGETQIIADPTRFFLLSALCIVFIYSLTLDRYRLRQILVNLM